MTTRHSVTPCGNQIELEGYDHVEAPITVRTTCADCSKVSDENPSGLTVVHMVSFPHPEGKEVTPDGVSD